MSCTGLRLAPGGAQEYSGLLQICLFWEGNWKWIPNRSCSGFGEDNVSTDVFPGTFGGEAINLWQLAKAFWNLFRKMMWLRILTKKAQK